MAHFTRDDILTATRGRLLAGAAAPAELGRVVTDSREVQPGDVFWALPGAQHDGAEFAVEAFARGAVGVVAGRAVNLPACEEHDDARCWAIEVEEPLAALWALARWNRERFSGTVIAVTGSVGKTTTREMIHAVLGVALSGSASPRNYNNHVGVPLAMLGMGPRDDYAVLELGASARGEIAQLAALVRPHMAVITAIGQAHLGKFGGQQAVADSKLELLAALEPGGCAVLNGDDPWLRRLATRSGVDLSWVGRTTGCDVSAVSVARRLGGLEFQVAGNAYRVPALARHGLVSALAAIAIAHKLSFTPEQIAAGLLRFQLPHMRCEAIHVAGATLINDAYNASPSAFRAALELLRDWDHPGCKLVVAGDMVELGEDSTAWHRRTGDDVVTLCGADALIACGRHAHDLVSAARAAGMAPERSVACRTPEEAAEKLLAWLAPGDAVLVKGSRAVGLEAVVAQVLAARGDSARQAEAQSLQFDSGHPPARRDEVAGRPYIVRPHRSRTGLRESDTRPTLLGRSS